MKKIIFLFAALLLATPGSLDAQNRRTLESVRSKIIEEDTLKKADSSYGEVNSPIPDYPDQETLFQEFSRDTMTNLSFPEYVERELNYTRALLETAERTAEMKDWEIDSLKRATPPDNRLPDRRSFSAEGHPVSKTYLPEVPIQSRKISKPMYSLTPGEQTVSIDLIRAMAYHHSRIKGVAVYDFFTGMTFYMSGLVIGTKVADYNEKDYGEQKGKHEYGSVTSDGNYQLGKDISKEAKRKKKGKETEIANRNTPFNVISVSLKKIVLQHRKEKLAKRYGFLVFYPDETGIFRLDLDEDERIVLGDGTYGLSNCAGELSANLILEKK